MNTRTRLWLCLIVIGAAAAGLAAVGSSPYPGVSVDSGEYLAVAEGLLDGEGLTMPYASYDEAYRILTPGQRVAMTQFPPLYPSVLALGGVAGASLLVVARILGALSYALLVSTGSYLVWRATRRTWAVVVAGGLLLAADLVTIHAMAWSEQLMLVGLAGCLLFAVRYWERGGAAPDLVGLGACAVLASMARFAGVSTAIAGAVVVWIARSDRARPRLLRAGAFLLLTLAPTLAWFVRNSVVTGSVSDKEPAWHPPSLTVLGQAMQTIGGWIVPWRGATMTAGLAVVLAVAASIVRRARSTRAAVGTLPHLCVVFAGCYALFLVGARTGLDQNIPFDNRLLSPLLVLAIVGLCALVGRDERAPRTLAAGALAVLALASVIRATTTALRFSETTVAAYSGDTWRASETLDHALRLPENVVVITNAPDPLWLWGRRPAQILPPRSSLYSGEPNERYSEQLRDLLASTRCERAVLVFFSQPTRKPARRVDPVVAGDLRVTDPKELDDGVVFEIDEPPCPT